MRSTEPRVMFKLNPPPPPQAQPSPSEVGSQVKWLPNGPFGLELQIVKIAFELLLFIEVVTILCSLT